MDRLTEWDQTHTHGQLVKGDGYTKLARYEDTGLEPGEVEKIRRNLAPPPMRRCRAKTWDRGKLIPVEGLFHQWGATFEEFEAGPANTTMAIIELDDGRIVEGIYHTVEFLDRGVGT